MGEVPTEFNFFLNFERILYWYELKVYFKKNLLFKLFYCLLPQVWCHNLQFTMASILSIQKGRLLSYTVEANI